MGEGGGGGRAIMRECGGRAGEKEGGWGQGGRGGRVVCGKARYEGEVCHYLGGWRAGGH